MATDSDVKKLADNVAVLQQDMIQVGALVDRLDVTIEKLTEVSTTVSQLLAVQVSRLEVQEKVQEKLQDLVEKRRQEIDATVKEIYNHITDVEKDLHEDIKGIEEKIIKKIEQMQIASTDQHEKINKDLSERMGKLEKWMWTVVGGGGAIMFILNNIDLLTLLQK